jgi:serine protease inhibitor
MKSSNASIIALFLLLTACAHDPAGPAREAPRNFTVQEARLASASVDFGISLYEKVAAGESKPNVLLSPLSASMALGMTMNGAEEGTYDAMRSALGFGSLSESEINESYRGLIAQLLARDSKVQFNLANSIWHERTFAVKQPFLDAAKTYFKAEVTALDFRDATAPKTISSWAEKETGGRIKELVKEIDPLEVMFLVNAVYFKAPWNTPFDPNSTRDGSFTRANGTSVTTKFMSRDGSFRYTQLDGRVMVELPYGDSAFSMILVGLDKPGTAQAPTITAAWWSSALSALRPGRIMLSLPKFKFEFGKKLNDALEALGMAVAFDPIRADFDRIGNRDDIYISRVEQKAFIDVHELGTEAAAATSVGVGVTSLPPSITFDRPFLFAIREKESGAILFIGRVGDPTLSN